MKKAFSIVLVVLILLMTASPAFAQSSADVSRMVDIQQRATFLAKSINKSVDSNGISLYNLSGSLEAICYPLTPKGYVIISYKNGGIIEYSLDGSSPFSESGINYYNGPMQYFTETSGGVEHTITSKQYIRNDIVKVLDEPLVKTLLPLPQSTRSWVEQGIIGQLSHSMTATGGHCCVPTAVAIVLYYSGAYPNGFPDVRSYMENNRYIPNVAQWLTQTKNGTTVNGVVYLGLQYYFNTGVVATRTVNVVDYSYSQLYTQVVSNRKPVIIEIPTALVDSSFGPSSMHAVTAYAIRYDTSNPNETEICVNTGWGYDLNISSSYMPSYYDIMYLS